MRVTLVIRFCLAFFSIVLLNLSGCGRDEPTPPNVLFITIDSLRAERLSAYTTQNSIDTKNLKELVKTSIVFENAITPTPLSCPSLATVFSSKNPDEHGVIHDGNSNFGNALPHLAEDFQRNGYTTLAFLSHPALSRGFGLERGFAQFSDNTSSKDEIPGTGIRPLHKTIALAQTALGDSIRSERPFFLWVHIDAPSHPYQAPEPFRSRFIEDPYGGEVAYVDNEIGHLLRLLREMGAERDTHVVIMGTYGESLGDHGENTHGLFIYDATVRVPLIWRRPGGGEKTHPKSVFPLRDLAPTLLVACGLEPNKEMKGLERTALLEGSEDLHSNPELSLAFIESRYGEDLYAWPAWVGLRNSQYKYIHSNDDELYDLGQDPSEKINVAKTHPDIVASMKSDLSVMMKKNQGTVTMNIALSRLSDKSPQDLALIHSKLDRLNEYVTQSRFSEAISESRFVLRQDSNNPLALRVLGVSLAEVSRTEEALEPLEHAVSLGQESADIRYALGIAYLRGNRWKEAILQFESAARLSPLDPMPRKHLGHAYELLGEKSKAKESYRQFLDLYEIRDELRGQIEDRHKELSRS